jgi:hypothetical protein
MEESVDMDIIYENSSHDTGGMSLKEQEECRLKKEIG